MKPSENDQPRIPRADVEDIWRRIADMRVVLVGGQAVNFWAEQYANTEPEIELHGPFTSKDIDFQATRTAVEECGARIGASPDFSVGKAFGSVLEHPSKGAQPLVRWTGDCTQGAGNFNTDGVNMIWTHGTGKAPDGTLEYPTRSIMTAAFTTDPAQANATAKRLRSDPGQLVPYPYGIGCGYAARQVFTPSVGGASVGSNDLLVVRLADGVSWMVSAPPVEEGTGFGFVLGMTCDEVFATANFPDEPNTIVRIRLDSLGPGMPPD